MTNKHTLSSATEDYLKAIYELQLTDGAVTTMALAGAMGVSAASTTNMVKKLAALKLARHAPYHGVELTPAGEKIALEVVRHHRLIELFLHEALGMPWDEVHAEAHKLEHVLSDKLEDHIADFLGDPTTDPHGDPIPSKAGIIAPTDLVMLADLAPNTPATIQRVAAQDPARLRYLREQGLVPNTRVTVVEHTPFAGPVRVRVSGGDERVIDRALAQQIWAAQAPPATRKKIARALHRDARKK